MTAKHIVFRAHALQRMLERHISMEEVESVLKAGETIATYPDDEPYPSRLILGWVGDRPLHVVVADDPVGNVLIVITVYEPDPALWESDFRRRRK